MSISLHPSLSDDREVEPVGHTYRLSIDQYQRMMDEGILTRADNVELRDGMIERKDTSRSEPIYRLSVDQYWAMTRVGILTKDDRVELLEGWLVAKMSKDQPHTISKNLTSEAIRSLLPPGWYVGIEDPVSAFDSEPEPDLSIVRGEFRNYPDHAPDPEHVALVIEVAHASPSYDQSIKKRLYARSGFVTYWLINLVASRVEVYTEPTGSIESPDYLQRRDFGPADQVPLMIAGVEVGRVLVRNLLP